MIGSSLRQMISGGKPPSFDDVMLVPAYSEIKSRSEPDTSSYIAGIKADIPVISSPMDTVTGPEMSMAMSSNGGLGILHRFASKEDQASMVEFILNNSDNPANQKIVPSIGVGSSERERFSYLYDKFYDTLSAIANRCCKRRF